MHINIFCKFEMCRSPYKTLLDPFPTVFAAKFEQKLFTWKIFKCAKNIRKE